MDKGRAGNHRISVRAAAFQRCKRYKVRAEALARGFS